MRLNKRIKEEYNLNKMISLKIPIKKRREYIETIYNCTGRLCFLPYQFNLMLDELSKNNIVSEKAVSEIEKRFEEIILSIQNNEIINPQRLI